MPTLHDIQKDFVDSLISAENLAILQHIERSKNLTEQQHVDIYRRNILGTFQKTLEGIYSVCFKLVGEEFFSSMAQLYMTRAYSHSPDLEDYGSDFADFISDFSPAKSLPYLADVARLEWAWHRIFNAPDQPEFDFQALANCYESDGDRIIFLLPEESFLLSSPYPIHQIWEMNQDHYSGSQTLILEDGTQHYFFVWRHGIELRIDALSHMEWELLSRIKSQLSLSEIQIQTSDSLSEADLIKILPILMQKKWFIGFRLKND
jgi:hypothetical protein